VFVVGRVGPAWINRAACRRLSSHQQVVAVMLFLVFLMMTLGLFALFLGGGLVAQGYLYQNPADRMPIRALAAALLVAGFVTLWVKIDQNAPGRYDTFFNFSSYSTAEFNEFEAIRWKGANGKLHVDASGNYIEQVVKYKRNGTGKDSQFVEEGTSNRFELHGTAPGGGQYMVGAVRIKGPNDPEPVRYNAELQKDRPKTDALYANPTDQKFKDVNGDRYIMVSANRPSPLFLPSGGTLAVALLLNFSLVVVWLVAFWPVLRFSLAHALIFGGAFALLTMLAVMPVLFKQNREPKPAAPTAAPATTMVWREANAPNA
jgi:hypothetical protein